MNAGEIVTPLVMGFMLGGLYALTALGLSMVFGVMRIINLAHGDLVLLGSYLSLALIALGLDPIAGLPVLILLLSALGFLIQKHLFGRCSSESALIVAFGISLIIQNANQLVWTPLSRGLNTSYSRLSFTIASRQFPLMYLLDLMAGVFVMLAIWIFLRRTYLGKAIVAASQNRKASQLMGINTQRVHAYAFAIAMIPTAIAAVFLGLTFPFTPTSGISLLTLAFGTVVVGGLGSMAGTFLGGVTLGIVQTLGGYYFGPASQMLVVYVAVFAMLAFKPRGLFGHSGKS